MCSISTHTQYIAYKQVKHRAQRARHALVVYEPIRNGVYLLGQITHTDRTDQILRCGTFTHKAYRLLISFQFIIRLTFLYQV